MSVVHNSYNQYLNTTVGTTGVGGTVVYFTLPWHPASIVDRIRIWNTSGNTVGVSNIVILNNAAHFRSGDITSRDQILYSDTTSTAILDGVYNNSFNLNPGVYVEDLYSRPYLSIKAILASAVTSGTYYCNAYGKKSMPSNYQNADSTQIQTSDNYRVLMARLQTGGTGGTIWDVTGVASKRGGENANEFGFRAKEDYIYVGNKSRVDHWDFVIKTQSFGGTAMSAEIWSGSAWKGVTVYDNSSNGIGSTGSLRYSGIIEAAGLGSSAWAPTVLDPALNNLLPNDPLTVQYKAIKNGTALPQYLPPNPDRFWIRFRLSNIDTAANTGGTAELFNIFPINEIY